MPNETTTRNSSEFGKQAILDAIRQCPLDVVPLPDLQQQWTVYDDPVSQFSEMVAAVGGQVLRAAAGGDINEQLDDLPGYRDADRICSLVPGVARANVSLETTDDPHELENVDWFIAPGEFGVAENGAVWLTDQSARHRVTYFINQHLVLVLRAGEIVNNMHEAYRRLQFDGPSFGIFLAGPSKTADIEQSLVIGAHGSRSLTVMLVG